jgi:glycosyltransferase involved in cell wall biosynthesis
MKFSVVIPCHNAERWIRATLRSVRAQTHPAHEIIVVDDDSSDRSLAAIRDSGVDVKLLQVKEHNAAATRNAGIDAATGDWVALLDADDIWLPHHLQYAAELLRKSRDVAFIAHHQYLDREGKVTDMPATVIPPIHKPLTGLPHTRFAEIAAAGFQFGHSTVIYHRLRLMDVGRFDVSQKRRHDMDLWLRMIANHTWTYDSRSHALYRHGTPGGISSNEINCEYYYLRALLRNQASYRCSAMRRLIETAARRSVSMAFVDGQRSDFRLALDQASPYLKPLYRMYYQVAAACPPLFRAPISAKRRIFHKRYHSTG